MSEHQGRIAQILRDRFRFVSESGLGEIAAEIDAALHPVIETVEQLDALPDHSIVRCAAGAAWHKQELYCSPGEPWWCAGSEIESPARDVMLPARVLYTPELAR